MARQLIFPITEPVQTLDKGNQFLYKQILVKCIIISVFLLHISGLRGKKGQLQRLKLIRILIFY